jgi:hypothetical protein
MAGHGDGREIARRIGQRIDEIYASGAVLGDDDSPGAHRSLSSLKD